MSVSKLGSEKTALAIGISDNAGLIVRYDDGTEELLIPAKQELYLPYFFEKSKMLHLKFTPE